jgi:hypothetical protein
VNHRHIALVVLMATLLAIGAFLMLMPNASADQRAVLPAAAAGCSLPAREAPGWQPTWLLVNTQTFTAYLPIVSNVQCRVGHTIDDAVNDVPLAHVDLVQSKSSELGYIFVEFKLRNIPSTLPFNRPGVPRIEDGCYIEYAWSAIIDTDDNKATGSEGYDLWIMAVNCPGMQDRPANKPLEQGVEVWLLRWEPSCNRGRGCYRYFDDGDLIVDEANDTLTMWGDPQVLIDFYAPIRFWTIDYNPEGNGVRDTSCF